METSGFRESFFGAALLRFLTTAGWNGVLLCAGKHKPALIDGNTAFYSRMAQEFDYQFRRCSIHNGVEQGFKPCVKSL
jgi:hypothetical protein